MAEALAARDGLAIAQEMGYPHVILESDSSVLVSALKMTEADRSRIAGLWHEIRALSRSFISFQVCWVRREANSLADLCSKFPSVVSPAHVWRGCFPPWLMEAATQDCNLLSMNEYMLSFSQKKTRRSKLHTEVLLLQIRNTPTHSLIR